MILNNEENPDSDDLGTGSGTDGDLQLEEPLKLKKQLGLADSVGMILGSVIGSGIFVSPLGVLYSTHSVGFSLIIWLLCGMFSLCGALCYAELGTSIPRSGGEFVYLQEAFGSLCAFLYLWVALLVINPTANAIVALTFGQYFLKPFFWNCNPPVHAVRLLATSVIILLTFINCYNVKWATRIQNVFAFMKIIVLVLIIFIGIVYMSMGETKYLSQPFKDSTYDLKDISSAFYSGMFSYTGWNCLNFITEEVKNPIRNLPRAIYITVPLVTVLYFLTNLAYFTILSRKEILSSWTVAETFGVQTLGSMFWIMPLGVALSTFGGLNGYIFTSSRLFFVGARQGQFLDSLAMISIRHFSPAPSLIFLAVVTVVYLWVGHVAILIMVTQFVESVFITTAIGALLWLRLKEPNKKRPVKVNTCLPVTFLMVGILLVVLPFFRQTSEIGTPLGIILSGIPAYFIFVYWKTKPSIFVKMSGSCTRFVQKLLFCSPQERKLTPDEETKLIDEYFEKLDVTEVQPQKVD